MTPRSYILSSMACFQFSAIAMGADVQLGRGDVRFPNALPGKNILVSKVYDPETGNVRIISNSPYIQSETDLVRLENEEEKLIRKKYGAISPDLRGKYTATGLNDSLDVMVSLKLPGGVPLLDKTMHSEEKLKEQSLALAAVIPSISVKTVLNRHGIRARHEESRSFQARLQKWDLEKVKFDADIASIDEYKENSVSYSRLGVPVLALTQAQTTYNLRVLAQAAYYGSSDNPSSIAGAGVNVATIESGINPVVMNCFGGLVGSRIDQNSNAVNHAHNTLRCLMRAAPGAKHWHRNDGSYPEYTDATRDWIIANGIQTSSLSYRRGEDYPSGPTLPEFRLMDYFAYIYPYPVFVTQTHNLGHQYESNWQNYNAISVGNVRFTNQSFFEVVTEPGLPEAGGCTQSRNPPNNLGACLQPPYSNGSPYDYCSSDREMPHILAPGYPPVDGTTLTDPCITGIGANTFCGTSLSSPILSGIAADVISANPSKMTGWPEKVRAVLLAKAKNVHGGYWSQGVDGKDGSGVVRGVQSMLLVTGSANHNIVPQGPAKQHGIYAHKFYAADFNGQPVQFNIQIPPSLPTGMHLRVVLTWDSNPLQNQYTNALSDLDLLVYTGNGYSGTSWNSNIEIVDVPRSQLTPNTTIPANIYIAINRIPTATTDAYYSPFFYYAIAWTWVED